MTKLGGGEGLRLDKWLWQARFFKTRSLCAKFVQTGRLRVNSVLVSKPHHAVKVGDVLTFPLGSVIKVVAVKGLGVRRGPAPEARTLYDDLSPPVARAEEGSQEASVAPRERGSGRPTKKERRETDRLRETE